MKLILLLSFLCMIAMQTNVLLSSSTSNTIITAPASQTVAVETFHTTNNLNFIGYSAQWLWLAGSDSWPNNYKATFQASFYADCLSTGTLIITADNIFSASLNGGPAMTGNTWTNSYSFTVDNIQCGLNTLIINVTNLDSNSPAAVIFAIVQEPGSCYTCRSPLSFYNRDTCKC
jgi:hypothetical protein